MRAPIRLRIPSIDQFRGFAILLMVLANYLAGVAWIPAWLKHAPDIGLTVIDLIAPFFIFSIGLTYALALRRRAEQNGWRAAAWSAVLRYLAIGGLGFFLVSGEILLGQSTNNLNWGVLQAIGAAGLLTMAFIRLPIWARALAGLALLALYQFLLDHLWLESVLAYPHGGPQGALGWTAMLILATTLADMFHAPQGGRARLLAGATALLLLGVVLSAWLPVSKNRVSATYVLVSLGTSGLLFLAFDLLAARLRLGLLSAWGKNPLILYVAHLLLLGLVVLPGLPGWYAQAPGWLVAAQAAGLLAGLSALALWLDRRKLIFSF